MQSADWCPFSWMYSNQAILLGSKAVVICPAEQGHAAFHDDVQVDPKKIIVGLYRRSLQQGNRFTKSLNLTVNIDRVLLPMLRQLHSPLIDSNLSKEAQSPETAIEHRSDDDDNDGNDEDDNDDESVACWSMRTLTDIYTIVTDVQDSTGQFFVSAPIVENDDNNHFVKIFTSIVGPPHEVRMLLDHRYFPKLSSCHFFAPGTSFCLPVEMCGYHCGSRLHLPHGKGGDDLSLGVRLSLTADTLRIEAALSLPESVSFFGGRVSFFLRHTVATTAVVPEALPAGTRRIESPFVAIRRTNCWFRSSSTSSSPQSTPIEAWSLPFMRNGWLQQLDEVDCYGLTANITVQVPSRALFWYQGQLFTDVTSQRMLQRLLYRVCQAHALHTTQCIYLASLVYRDLFQQQVLLPAWQLPSRQWFPTPQRPFVFLHMDTCAGTTVRALLDTLAHRWGLDAIIPCYGNLSCFIFDLPMHQPSSHGPAASSAALLNVQRDLSQVSIVAGHFPWGIWRALPSCGGGDGGDGRNAAGTTATAQRNAADCTVAGFVMLQHPVERVVSQYYERIYTASTSPHYRVHLNELSEEVLAALMVTFRWGRHRDNDGIVVVDEGLSDVYCRSLLGRRTTSGRVLYMDERDDEITLSSAVYEPNDVKEALRRLNELVVGIEDRWEDTLQVLSFWFPWFEYDKEHVQTKIHTTKAKDGVDIVASLKPSLRRVIEDASQCDLVLYDAAVRRFEAQIRVLQSDGSEVPTHTRTV